MPACTTNQVVDTPSKITLPLLTSAFTIPQIRPFLSFPSVNTTSPSSLSAQSDYFAIIWNGTRTRVGGTSASCPTTAGVFALVNDALITAHRPPMGFLNPWLYSRGYAAFTDVTNGSSFGCGTPGFPAQAGWDAATGVGTPDFGKILALLELGGVSGGH